MKSVRILSGLLALSIVFAVLAPQEAAARSRKRRHVQRTAAQPVAPLAPATPPTGQATIDLDRVEGTTLFFKPATGSATAPAPVKSDVSELKYLGALRPGDGTAPYFFLSGRQTGSGGNPGELQVFVFRPGFAQRITSFVYPGRILDPKTRAPLLESRAFIGRCLRRTGSDVYVVFQRERVDRKNRLQTSVFIAEPANDHLSERLSEKQLPRLDDTLRLVRSKVCREIDGRNRLMLAKPLDLTPRRGLGDNDEDDEDENDKHDPEPGEAQQAGTPAASSTTPADAP